MKFLHLALFVLLVHLKLSVIEPVTAAAQKAAVSRNPADDLSMGFYDNTCPDVEDIIQQTVGAWIQNDSTLAPSLLRLLFHHCAVRVSRSAHIRYYIDTNSFYKFNQTHWGN